MYQLSIHAIHRIKERRLKIEWLLAALDGKEARMSDGTVFLVDPASRCALIIARDGCTIVTVVRMRPARYKRMFSKRRKTNGRRVAFRTPTDY